MLLGYWDKNRFLSNQRVALRLTMQGSCESSAAVPVIGENRCPALNLGPPALSISGCCPDIYPVAWHNVRTFMMINARLTMQGLWQSSAAVPVIGENDCPALNLGPQAISILGCCPGIHPMAWHNVRTFMMINARLTMECSYKTSVAVPVIGETTVQRRTWGLEQYPFWVTAQI